MINKIITIFILILNFGCSSGVIINEQIYEEKFGIEKYDKANFSDTILVNSLNIIQEIKREIYKEKLKGKVNPNFICYLLGIRSDLGGHLEKSLIPISKLGYGRLDLKYHFYEDCRQLDLDKSLFYLTNLEKDILYIYIRLKNNT